MSNTFNLEVGLSPQDLHQIERFETAYNAIDRHLRKALNKGNNFGFAQLIQEYSERGKLRRADQDSLRAFSELRNVLVHEKLKPSGYLAVPAPFVVEQIESIRNRLLTPERVIPKFLKKVESVGVRDSLAVVLKLIAQRDYSQFPVYDSQHFKGLLTENGITRWLAHHVSNVLTLIDLEEVPVKQVLGEEEPRENFAFVPRTATVNEASFLFAERELLEAILITQTGKRTESLLGIVNRWDIVHLNKD